MLEVDKIYTLQINGTEVVAKIVKCDTFNTIVAHPMTLVPTQQGLQMLPSLMSANPDKNVTINTASITMHVEAHKDIQATYIQATTGIVTAPKTILKG
jgi:hypothetical protein